MSQNDTDYMKQVHALKEGERLTRIEKVNESPGGSFYREWLRIPCAQPGQRRYLFTTISNSGIDTAEIFLPIPAKSPFMDLHDRIYQAGEMFDLNISETSLSDLMELLIDANKQQKSESNE